ncbi:MAG: LuxR C-terminal-related transcriptional regulator [Pseudomonadota bacterium]
MLIVAGAGFGKRSLIRSWAVETDGPAIKWLEVSDQLPAPTWQGVVIAVGIHEAALDALGKSGRAWRLILVAGHEPETDLSVAKLNGMLTVLDADNLRMTDTEIADLLPNATPSEVARTIEATGGWPVAVQALASRLAHHEDMAQLESEFSNLTAAIFDFCESHVLEAADARERAFLTSLSAMPELDLRLAERLVGEESGKAAVETAVRFGLVRRKPNKGYCWSQCHTVLARHLQALETELRPDAIRKLHDIAADHFSAGEEHELAIYHAYAAENWPKVATYIERAGGWRLAVDLRNRLSSRDWLYNCIEDLPETCVKDSPALQLARAMLRFCCGEIRPAMRDYEQLLAARTGLDETLDLEVTIVGLLMRMLEERPPSSSRRREIQHCLKRIPSTDAMSIALMENALSIAAAQRGETDDALESAERARRLYVRVGAKESVSVVGLLQGRICAQAGLRNLALQHLRGAQTAFEQQLGFNSDLARCARLLIGHQALASNDLQTARDYTSDVLPWVEAQEPQFHAAAYLSCAKLAVLDNGLDAGARVIDTCIRFAQRRGLERLERLAQICWLEQLCGAGEAKAAAHLAHETQLQDLVENQSDPLLAQHAAFTLAEIEIGCGEPAAAQARLAAFQRSKCWIESTSARIKKHLLSALIYHLMDGETAAHGEIKEAIRLAAPEGLPRLFIARGAEMYTLLRSFQKADPQKGRFANHVHDEFVSDVLSSIRREQRTNRISAEGIALTTKEEEIVELVTKGLSNKEIARLVDASDNTVKWHLKNLFRRFEVSSRDELATAYHINLTKRRNHNIHVSMASLRIQ